MISSGLVLVKWKWMHDTVHYALPAGDVSSSFEFSLGKTYLPKKSTSKTGQFRRDLPWHALNSEKRGLLYRIDPLPDFDRSDTSSHWTLRKTYNWVQHSTCNSCSLNILIHSVFMSCWNPRKNWELWKRIWEQEWGPPLVSTFNYMTRMVRDSADDFTDHYLRPAA